MRCSDNPDSLYSLFWLLLLVPLLLLVQVLLPLMC
jgi:hypothetical protein